MKNTDFIGFIELWEQQRKLSKIHGRDKPLASLQTSRTPYLKIIYGFGSRDGELHGSSKGVLKKLLATNQIGLANSSCNSNSCSDAASKHVISRICHGKMTIELLSSSAGIEGAAKAANFLFSNYLKKDVGNCNMKVPTFTETDVAAALKAVGCDGPNPDYFYMDLPDAI